MVGVDVGVGVGGSGVLVAVGGTGVAVGGTGVSVGGTSVGVFVAVGATATTVICPELIVTGIGCTAESVILPLTVNVSDDVPALLPENSMDAITI